MRRILLLSSLPWALTSPAAAADSAHCDSKPFSLKKPTSAQAAPQQTSAQAAPAKPANSASAPAKPAQKKPKKVTIGCNQPKD